MPQTCNFIKKETLAQVFSCEFCETSKNNFLQRTHLMAASAHCCNKFEKSSYAKHLVVNISYAKHLNIMTSRQAYLLTAYLLPNTEFLLLFGLNTGKYGPEKTPYLGTF